MIIKKTSIKIDGELLQYEQRSGVLLGENFISREEFGNWIKEDLVNNLNTDEFEKLKNLLEKSYKEVTNKKTQKTTINFKKNLQKIRNSFDDFSKIAGKGIIGGDISLLSTFNFDSEKETTSYIVKNERDLSRTKLLKRGILQINNTENNINKLMKETNRVEKMNKVFQQHLNDFYTQLIDRELQSDKERKKLYVWAYQNMKKRYIDNKGHTPNSLAEYFWGKGHLQGYVLESYGAHIGLAHPNILKGSEAIIPRSVIAEHGGPGSRGLFELLASSKGNTSAQIGGDIIIIDADGKIKLNIQSKASTTASYTFSLKYQQFLRDLLNLIKLLEEINSFSNAKNIEEEIDELYKAFSAEAWVPIEKKIIEKTIKTGNGLINNMVKNLTN